MRADPAAAATLLVKANPSLEPKLQLASIQQTLPAALPGRPAIPIGYQDPSAWAAFGNWMFDHGLLRHNPDDTALPPFTNEFLPGEGLGKNAGRRIALSRDPFKGPACAPRRDRPIRRSRRRTRVPRALPRGPAGRRR